MQALRVQALRPALLKRRKMLLSFGQPAESFVTVFRSTRTLSNSLNIQNRFSAIKNYGATFKCIPSRAGSLALAALYGHRFYSEENKKEDNENKKKEVPNFESNRQPPRRYAREIEELKKQIDSNPFIPSKIKKSVKDYIDDFAKKDKKSERSKNPEGEPENPDGEGSKDEEGKKRSSDRKGFSSELPPGVLAFRVNPQQIILWIVLGYLTYLMFNPGGASREITWQEFRSMFLDKGLVERLTVVNKQQVRVHLNAAASNAYPGSAAGTGGIEYYFSIGSIDAFERRLEDAQRELKIPSSEYIPVAYHEETSWGGAIFSLLPTALVIGAIWWLSRRAGGAAGPGGPGGGIFSISKSKARVFNHETDVKVKFSDVAGCDEAKEEIQEFVKFLKNPAHYEALGAKIPRGAILSGPPGTGKTLLAKATAGEAAVSFLSVSGSEFIEMFVGVGPSRVRDLFTTARKNQPCIIFIDEIDAIGKSRGRPNSLGGNDERESTLNQLLVEMDGFSSSEHVVILAGTNRSDVLDPALLRPGRFDRHIVIDKPDIVGRQQIFKVHLKKIVTEDSMEKIAERLAILTPGFTGADIMNCCNEGALIAARNDAKKVSMKHFEAAIERVTAGLEKKSRVLSPKEKNTVAHHEAGHAVCGWYLENVDPLLKVSIIPRAQALGYASYLPQDQYLMSRNQILDRMCMALGGRVSEEMFFGKDEITSGASDDFQKVTRMATAYVSSFGMSDAIGTVTYPMEGNESFQKPFSEATAKIIDEEVRKIVTEARKRTRKILEEHKDGLKKLAKYLLEKEVIAYADVQRILGPRPFKSKVNLQEILGEDPPAVSPPQSPPVEPSPEV